MKKIKVLPIGAVVLALALLSLIPTVVRDGQGQAVSQVFAQDTATTENAQTATGSALSTDEIFTKPRQSEEILKLRELYQDQVERYSTLQREYLINKAQFEKLNTLQSLEEAIKSTREVMLARTDVLITYFELMRSSLDDTEGVELTEKQKNIDEMVSYIEKLRLHREVILKTTDREDIALRVKEFAELSEPFESTAYKALALIRIGDIQTVFDKSEIIYADLLKYHGENKTSPLKQAERERAYRQVENAVEKTRSDLLMNRSQYSESQDLNRSSYDSRLSKSLNTSYTGTSQILSFLKELFVELT